jgi:3-oxoacyl-[acyl-carrier-protein] synthase II
MQTVCVTGYGVVSPWGADLGAFEAALFAGHSAVRAEAIELPGLERFRVPLARSAFDARAVQSPSRVPLDRGSAMALAAADAAAAMAQLHGAQLDAHRLGIYWGSGMGGAETFDATCRALYADQRRIRPTSVVTAMPNAPVAELALRFGARGAAQTYACACASAAVAIGEALRALREGRLDVAVAGGSEAMLTHGVIGAWHALRVLADVGEGRAGAFPDGDDAAWACKPFAASRSGFALGEGAAAFILETEAHARARGATRSLVLSGYASNCDAMHITKPDTDGQVRAIESALRDAGLAAADIGHVNAHGTATLAGDTAEAASLGLVFGDHGVPVTATKAGIGHLLGAGSAIELAATLLALQRGQVPPTGGDAAIDPALAIDVVRGAPRDLPALRHAMSTSFAFGGTNAVLIVSSGGG